MRFFVLISFMILSACELTGKAVANLPGTVQTAGAVIDDDQDHDGLSDAEEERLGTDPKNADTDGDGLSDGTEVNVTKTNPKEADSDGGGVNDGIEVERGTDPNNASDDLPVVGGGIDPQPVPMTLLFKKTPTAQSAETTSTFQFASQPNTSSTKYTCKLSNNADSTIVNVACRPDVDFTVSNLKANVAYKLSVTADDPPKTPAAISYDWQVVVLACGQANGVDTLQKTFKFAATTSTCDWGIAPNGPRLNGFLQAVRTLTVPLGIANNDKLCSVTVKINQAGYLGDDATVLHMNEIPLATNAIGLLIQRSGNLVYDFSAIQGTSNTALGPYCLGPTCTMPRDGVSSAFIFTSGPELLARLRADAPTMPSLSLSLSLHGDNDDSDCRTLGLTGTVDYTTAK